MKEYLKKFESVEYADNYIISDIPFATSIATDPVQNLVCNQTGKRLVNVSGVMQVQPMPPTNEIWYTSSDGNIVTPYQTSTLLEIDTNTYGDGKGVIKFKTDVTGIGTLAFNKCATLLSIDIPNSVTSIGDKAFKNCSGLTSVKIFNGVTNIGEEAFSDCKGLISISIPNSVTSIGTNAFLRCSNLISVTIDSDAIINKTYSSSSTIQNIFRSQVKKYIIGNSVTGIGNYAFYRANLTSVKIGNRVTRIGYYAFEDCSSLTSITIPNTVTSIGNGAFLGCKGLTSITIPNSVTNIGFAAFSGCSSLTSITIPNSVTHIGDTAFNACTSLESITVDVNNPNYCSEDGVLFNKDKTTLIQYPIGKQDTYAYTIPNSVARIEHESFEGCTGLTSITIPNSVTSIGGSAFSGCTGLTSLTIPDSVTNIESDTIDLIFNGAFGSISAKISFSKLYSTYTNKIFNSSALSESVSWTYNVEFNISEIPTGYNISSMLPQASDNDEKVTITYNIYTDYEPCKDQALALANTKTIVNVYHIDGTPWE